MAVLSVNDEPRPSVVSSQAVTKIISSDNPARSFAFIESENKID
jgi:hypothetical protein